MSHEVSLGGRLHPFVVHPHICVLSACSHALAFGVILTIAIDFAHTGDRYGRQAVRVPHTLAPDPLLATR